MKKNICQKDFIPIHLWEMTCGQHELMHSRIEIPGMAGISGIAVMIVTICLCPPHLPDQDVENFRGLYWKHDGVLEAPVSKMTDPHGRHIPEKVCNFAKPVFPLVYWKIISRETNNKAQE
jgi:hypothetical protein